MKQDQSRGVTSWASRAYGSTNKPDRLSGQNASMCISFGLDLSLPASPSFISSFYWEV